MPIRAPSRTLVADSDQLVVIGERPSLPAASFDVDGSVRLFGAVVLVALFAAFGLLLWAMRFSRTRTIHCPDQGRKARVVVHFAPDGTPMDVETCSLQRTRVNCSMRCLSAA